MTKFLLTILSLILFASSAVAGEYKIGLISDLHDINGIKYEALDTILGLMESQGTIAYIMLGDIINTWDSQSVVNIGKHFKNNTYWTMGGHDGGLVGEQVCPINFVPYVAKYQTNDTECGDLRFNLGNWTLLLLQTGIVKVSDLSLKWLADTLKDTPNDKQIIIATHMGIMPRPGDEGDFLYAENAGAIMEIINNAVLRGKKVRLLLFGHGHSSTGVYPTYDVQSGIINFEITAAQNANNAAVLTLNDDGSFYIDGIGTQKNLFVADKSGTTYILNSATGVDEISPVTFPKKTIGGLFGLLNNTISPHDAIIMRGSPMWGTYVNGTLHNAIISKDISYPNRTAYSSILNVGNKNIKGITTDLPQGSVFIIREVQ